jgi:stage III sporulation protein AA
MIASISLEKTVIPILPTSIAAATLRLSASTLQQITEIRLRVGQPVLIMTGRTDRMLCSNGVLTSEASQAVICTRADITKALQLISRNSLYAFEQELQAGYITISGGHRVGIAGQAIVDNGKLKALKNISSLNIRLAREQKGAADLVFPFVVNAGRIASTLIISPPRCGKTTMLRDLIRQISSGSLRHGFTGAQVGVVDERSEIAGCCDGVPTVDLGPRVDVLDGCPKAVGMIMLIRSMAPEAIATDELGSAEDARAVREALHAGVAVLATLHGLDAADAARRPNVGDLLREQYFERFIILSDQPAIGTVEEITDAHTGQSLYNRKNGVKVCG